MGNWNEPIAQVERKCMSQHEMQEALLEQHGTGPATFEHGKTTIDSIFMSRSLNVAQGGYLPFHLDIESNHQALWVDVTFTNTFGVNMSPIEKIVAN